MNRIHALVRIASRRLAASRFLAVLHDALVVALGVAILMLAISKMTPAFSPPWPWVLGGLLLACVIVAAVAAVRGRLAGSTVAAFVDERLGLADRFSTAINCEGRSDAFARVAVEDAIRTAEDPKLAGRVRSAFPIAAPRGGWVAPTLLAMALGIWFLVPSGDVFADEDDAQTVDQRDPAADEDVVERLENVIETVKQNELLEQELGDLLAQATDDPEFGADGEDLNGREETPLEAMRDLSSLEQRLDEIINGERGKSVEAMRDALREAMSGQEAGDADAQKLIEALRSGDFGAAREALENLQKKMDAGEMTDEQREQLAKDIENLAKSLAEAEAGQKQLENALRDAGMDPDLANNQAALEQALQEAVENGSISEQQAQQIQQAAQAQQNAQQQMQQMSQAMQQMASQCQGGGQQGQQGQQGSQSGQQGQQGSQGQQGGQMMGQQGNQQNGAQQMSQMLSDAEMAQQMLAAAYAAQGQCQGGGSGQNQFQIGASMSKFQNSGNGQGAGGMGGAGRGAGGDAPIAPTRFGLRRDKADTELQQGTIIGRQFFEGEEQLVGEARVQYERIVTELRKRVEEEVSDDPVPPHLRDVHKRYFDQMRKRLVDAYGEPTASGEADGAAESTSDE